MSSSSPLAQISVNKAAFGTVTLLGAATIASVVAAATTANIVAIVAFSILSVGLGAVSIASITAWVDSSSITAEAYFKNIKEHAAISFPAAMQFVAQVLVQSLIEGIGRGIGNAISRKISGPDVVVEYRDRRK